MKKRNGFTLIELLAVIIILAAIALIIAPMVLDVIKEQQKKTFKESINGILRSSKLELVNSGLSFPAEFTYSDGKLLSPTGKELKITGKIPEGSGTLIYNSEDDIELAIYDNTWCGTYNKDGKEVEVNEYTGDCTIVPSITVTPEKCFQFDSSTGTITKYNKSDLECPMDVVIPDTIGGVEVKIIGTSAFDDGSLCNERLVTSVVLPSSIELIEESAFIGEYIDVNGYHNSQDDNNVLLLNNSKKDYSIDRLSNEEECLVNKISFVDFSKTKKLTEIQYSAFAGNRLTSVILPESLVKIGYKTFAYNQLTEISIGSHVELIGGEAFKNNNLTSVIIPANVKEIGAQAFYENQLIDVDIKNGITTIKSNAFYQNPLTNVDIPSSVTSVNKYSFPQAVFMAYKTGDYVIVNNIILDYLGSETEVVIPEGIISIEEGAFLEKQLTSAIISSTVSKIMDDAFYNNNITNLVIPSNVKDIGSSAFAYNNITSLTLEEGVKTIGDSTFSDNQLTSVVIPESVTSIGPSAFEYNQLTSVTIKGKSSSADFESYPEYSWSAPFGWAEGYSDSNIIWEG